MGRGAQRGAGPPADLELDASSGTGAAPPACSPVVEAADGVVVGRLLALRRRAPSRRARRLPRPAPATRGSAAPAAGWPRDSPGSRPGPGRPPALDAHVASSGRPAANDGVGEAADLHHLLHVVDAHDVGAVGDGDGDAGGRAEQPLLDRQAEHGADGRLAGGADQHRAGPATVSSPRRRSISRLCSTLQPKPKPGSMISRSRGTPAACARSMLVSRPCPDVADDVVEGAAALVVHDHRRHAEARDDAGHLRVAAEAPDVVHHDRARFEGGVGDVRLRGVDADGHVDLPAPAAR